MNTRAFQRQMANCFSQADLERPTLQLEDPEGRAKLDPCPDVRGMTAVKNQMLLRIAYGCLPPIEAYLEIGTFQGKTLISAIKGQVFRPTYACDNFSEWSNLNKEEGLRYNLQQHGLMERVHFLQADFLTIFKPETLPDPIGLYFFDGPHDEPAQYMGIKLAEPYLADEALVLVDDWRFAADSQSYAKAGTMRAVEESDHAWTLLYDLPARYNGDHAMWWNGLAVFQFRRGG